MTWRQDGWLLLAFVAAFFAVWISVWDGERQRNHRYRDCVKLGFTAEQCAFLTGGEE